MISFDLPGCRFLDLFAGSGAIGMEALSRGAEQAVFVENAAPCQDVIARNLAHTKLGEGARVLCMEASAALDRLAEENAAFDLVYIDPPYEAGLAEPMLEKRRRVCDLGTCGKAPFCVSCGICRSAGKGI